jgi:hypothetical protein
LRFACGSQIKQNLCLLLIQTKILNLQNEQNASQLLNSTQTAAYKKDANHYKTICRYIKTMFAEDQKRFNEPQMVWRYFDYSKQCRTTTTQFYQFMEG